jgi:hypothetical protein
MATWGMLILWRHQRGCSSDSSYGSTYLLTWIARVRDAPLKCFSTTAPTLCASNLQARVVVHAVQESIHGPLCAWAIVRMHSEYGGVGNAPREGTSRNIQELCDGLGLPSIDAANAGRHPGHHPGPTIGQTPHQVSGQQTA